MYREGLWGRKLPPPCKCFPWFLFLSLLSVFSLEHKKKLGLREWCFTTMGLDLGQVQKAPRWVQCSAYCSGGWPWQEMWDASVKGTSVQGRLSVEHMSPQTLQSNQTTCERHVVIGPGNTLKSIRLGPWVPSLMQPCLLCSDPSCRSFAFLCSGSC